MLNPIKFHKNKNYIKQHALII